MENNWKSGVEEGERLTDFNATAGHSSVIPIILICPPYTLNTKDKTFNDNMHSTEWLLASTTKSSERQPKEQHSQMERTRILQIMQCKRLAYSQESPNGERALAEMGGELQRDATIILYSIANLLWNHEAGRYANCVRNR